MKRLVGRVDGHGRVRFADHMFNDVAQPFHYVDRYKGNIIIRFPRSTYNSMSVSTSVSESFQHGVEGNLRLLHGDDARSSHEIHTVMGVTQTLSTKQLLQLLL